jgi:hypothetical protein
MVSFLIDSGSSCSAISEREADLMNLEIALFPERKQESVGFGGAFKSRIINCPIHLTFGSDKQKYRITCNGNFFINCIPSDKTPEEREKLLQLVPSVLGMDLLGHFETRLTANSVELLAS